MRISPATLLFSLLALCPAIAEANRSRDDVNVVVVVLDGVRWQEVLEGTDPALAGERRPLFRALRDGLGGRVLAVPDARVANGVFKSLPAYESLLTGRWSGCRSNECGRVAVETLPDRLAAAGLPAAVIASWATIDRAASSRPGTVLVNTGLRPLDDGAGDPVVAAIDAAQAADPPPWGAARRDRYTMAHALRHLRLHRPRFLFVALNDADEWAHQGDYRRYVEALDSYDRWLAELAATTDALDAAEGGRTLLFVTTDHGRGRGDAWRNHGGDRDAARVWMYLRLAGGAPPDHALGRVTHADLRPTIEAIFGLDPTGCPACGRPLAAVLAWARLPDAGRLAGAMNGRLEPALSP